MLLLGNIFRIGFNTNLSSKNNGSVFIKLK